MIDRNTPFREIGDCALGAWLDEGRRLKSPMTQEQIWHAMANASPHGALALAQGVKESQLGKTAPAANNFLGLMADGRFVAFGSWAECAAEFRRRLDDLAYKGGVYAPREMPLVAYVATYVGGPGCWASAGKTCANGETWDGADGGSVGLYLRQTIARLNSYLAGDEEEAGVAFGLVTRPEWRDRIIPDFNNSAWSRTGQRTVRGVVYHRMLGTLWGTDAWFRGGGGKSALTDFGLDHQSGELLQWNDHTGKGGPGYSANRSPWASGPWENPPGDGRAFVAKYGIEAINRDLVSIEISGNYGDPVSGAALQRLAHLTAWLADQARIPWDVYPANPATGLTFTYWHAEFTSQKPCPGAWVVGATEDIHERTRQILKSAQTQGEPVTPPAPEPDAMVWPGRPNWMDVRLIPLLFPEADPSGLRTQSWLRYCGTTGHMPARKAFVFKDTPEELVLFEGGLAIDKAGKWVGQ